MQENPEYFQDDEKEIDLLELAGKLWQERRLLIRCGIIGAVIGLIVAFSIPREYTTTIKLVPELNNDNTRSRTRGLSALASMAGINLLSGGGMDAVHPELYPDVVGSVPFNLGLFNVPVRSKNGEIQTTLRGFIEDETSGPWWGTVMGIPGAVIGGVKSLFVDDEPADTTERVQNSFQITKEESRIIGALGKRIAVNVDTKTAVITLSVTMQDPLVSAIVADTVAERLKNYITEYRTNKARKDMQYAQIINDEAKADYYEAQQCYAEYMDKNHGIAFNSRKTEEERLKNEMQLAYSLYNSTAQQLQMAKAKVQETTPVYAVLQPATVPLKPSKPSKIIILAGWIFLMVAGASVWVLFGRDFKSKIKETLAASKE